MKSITRLAISLLLIVVAPALCSAAGLTTLSEGVVRCASISNSQQRLACYDELARKLSSANAQAQSHHFIQPPARFLESHLVAEAWKAEYTLTVQDFVDLISHAVMDNKQHVTVQGWSRDNEDYILHITMRTPVNLHFMPRSSDSGETPMSLLRAVTMGDNTIGADQFILIIAAMDSDAKTDNAN